MAAPSDEYTGPERRHTGWDDLRSEFRQQADVVRDHLNLLAAGQAQLVEQVKGLAEQTRDRFVAETRLADEIHSRLGQDITRAHSRIERLEQTTGDRFDRLAEAMEEGFRSIRDDMAQRRQWTFANILGVLGLGVAVLVGVATILLAVRP
jgi:septal ring factor EnvC (AmiA/AmiB activator)